MASNTTYARDEQPAGADDDGPAAGETYQDQDGEQGVEAQLIPEGPVDSVDVRHLQRLGEHGEVDGYVRAGQAVQGQQAVRLGSHDRQPPSQGSSPRVARPLRVGDESVAGG